MFRLALSLVVFGLVPLVGAQEQKVESQDKPAEVKAAAAGAQDKKAEAPKPSPDVLHPRVKMATTLGDIVLELDSEKAPITVQNFLQYAQDGYYQDTVFHRVMSTFMIQGGGFTTEMDQKKEGLRPPIKNEWKNGLKNARGTISMARTSAPDSATSQFFINVVDNNRLDMPRGGAAYCVFGRVVEGMEVVDKIKDAEVIKHPKYKAPQAVTPKETIVIKSVTLLEGFDPVAVLEAIKARHAARFEAEELAKAEEGKQKQGLAKEFEELLSKKVDQQGNKLQTTESGLMYVVLRAGDGASPKPTDVIVAHYTGWLLDGTKFDSSHDRGKPLTSRLNGLVKGWIEGVGMMKAGGKWRLVIPPELAYGPRGRGGIPPNSTLVFDMELLEIK